MKNDTKIPLDPALKTATDAALMAKKSYRQAEAELMKVLETQVMVPQLPGEASRDYSRRVRQTARDWLAMHEEERDWGLELSA